jgi:hypothetical protein
MGQNAALERATKLKREKKRVSANRGAVGHQGVPVINSRQKSSVE